MGQIVQRIPTPVWLFLLASIALWLSFYAGFAVAYDQDHFAALNATFFSSFVITFVYVPATVVLLYLRRALRGDGSRAWRIAVTWGIGLGMFGLAITSFLGIDSRRTTDLRAIESAAVVQSSNISGPIESHRIGGGFVDASDFFRFTLDVGEPRFQQEDLTWERVEPSWVDDAQLALSRWGGDAELLDPPGNTAEVRYAELPEKLGVSVCVIWFQTESNQDVLVIWRQGY